MIRTIGKTLQCTRCHEKKPLSAFSVRRGGYPQSWCKQCKNAQSTVYKRRSRAAAKTGEPIHQGRNGRRQRDAPPPNNSEETDAILRAKLADREFKLRMLAARNSGRESFVLGIDRHAGVE